MQSVALTLAAISNAFSSEINLPEICITPQLLKKCIVDPDVPKVPPNF